MNSAKGRANLAAVEKEKPVADVVYIKKKVELGVGNK